MDSYLDLCLMSRSEFQFWRWEHQVKIQVAYPHY